MDGRSIWWIVGGLRSDLASGLAVTNWKGIFPSELRVLRASSVTPSLSEIQRRTSRTLKEERP
jgi:hypothetical protein